MTRNSMLLGVAILVTLVALPACPAAAEEVPDFWVAVNNGMGVYGLSGGQAAVPYVVAHVAQAEVDCTLDVFTVRGFTESPVMSVPMGTVTAADKYFCNTATGGALPFTFVWEDVPLAPGTYGCRVVADDGTTVVESSFVTQLQIMSTADVTSPLNTTPNYDGSWRRSSFELSFIVTDDPDGWGADGGLAHVDCSLDGGGTWMRAPAEFPVWRRGGGSGVHTVLFRGTDAAGNEEQAIHSCQVYIDARPPITMNDAPVTPQSGDVTVHFAAVDNLLGVTACSGVAATWYCVDTGRWQKGSQVTVRSLGPHCLSYYSVDNAGNSEYLKRCWVTIGSSAAGPAGVRGLRH